MRGVAVTGHIRSLAALEAWAERRPGRGFTVAFVDGRWRATLATFVEAGGASLQDALAQIAQVAVLEEDKSR
jgi:hypothetical protein